MCDFRYVCSYTRLHYFVRALLRHCGNWTLDKLPILKRTVLLAAGVSLMLWCGSASSHAPPTYRHPPPSALNTQGQQREVYTSGKITCLFELASVFALKFKLRRKTGFSLLLVLRRVVRQVQAHSPYARSRDDNLLYKIIRNTVRK